jgi:hypothetical protein
VSRGPHDHPRSGGTMPDKDKAELLLKLAEAAWRDYSERRSVEWKVNFALWAGLGAFGGFVFQQQKALPPEIALAASILLGCAFLVYTFLWKTEVQRRNGLDLDAAQYYWTKVDRELDVSSPEVRTRQKGVRGWRKTHLSQVIITFLFVLLSILALWTSNELGKAS